MPRASTTNIWQLEQRFQDALAGGQSRVAVAVALEIVRAAPSDERIWSVLLDALPRLPLSPAVLCGFASAALAALSPSSPTRQRAEQLARNAELSLARQARRLAAERASAPPPARPDSPPSSPPRRLSVPVHGPEGAAVVLDVAPLAPPLARAAEGRTDDLEAYELAARALELESAEHFDRLLALERTRGLEHYPHQTETVLRVLKRFHGRALLADEVGLGKTVEAGLVLAEYLARGLVRRALVLCPSALVLQWRGELEEKFGIAARTTIDGAWSKAPRAFLEQDGVVVASLATVRARAHHEIFEAQRFDLVVVDEAHHLKNRKTRGWELVNALRSRFLLLLTATPVETDLGELYNLVTLLRPGTLGTEADFRRRFQKKGDPLSPEQPHELRELLREVMIRNTRAASGVGLPPRTVRTVVVDPSPDESALYGELVALARDRGARVTGRANLYRLLLEEAGSSAAALARTLERAGGDDPDLARLAERARTLPLGRKGDWLADLVPGGKLLCFTRFRATHEAILVELERRGVRALAFAGGLSAGERAAVVEEFREGDAQVLVCSEVGGEGQNLQFCHRLVNFDLPWNPMLLEQRVGRIHRIGQREPVEVVNLCTGGTAEERILDVLDRRVNLFELVVGELDLVLGDLEDEREFGDQVYEIYSSSASEEDVVRGFEALGDRIAEARSGVDSVREAAQATFGDSLGV
jgi:SNF2 family DNA or RNA helicase